MNTKHYALVYMSDACSCFFMCGLKPVNLKEIIDDIQNTEQIQKKCREKRNSVAKMGCKTDKKVK